MAELKCGIYGQFVPPLDAAVRYAVTCEEMGLDAVAFTDQIQGNVPRALWKDLPHAQFLRKQHAFLDASVVMTLAAAATHEIELFLGAIDAVRHSPSKLAQHFLTLDHVAKGRAWFALGGSEAKNVVQFGHSRIGSGKKFEDALAIVRLMLDHVGEPVWYQGEAYAMKGGLQELGPHGDRAPLVLAATGGGPEVLALVGKHSDGLLTNLPGMCPGGPEQFAADRRRIREEAEKAGRDPDRLRFAASVLVLMQDDPEEIRRLAGTFVMRWNTIVYGAIHGAQWKRFGFTHPLGEEWAYPRHLVPERMAPEEVMRAADAVPIEAVCRMGHFTGTAEAVADQILPYAEAGLDYAFIVDYAPYADPSIASASAANLDRLVKRLRAGRGITRATMGWLGLGAEQ
jgi:phthiodiolone/phenolphthiodiolone dimycocerosates ketoreductase